MSIAIIDAYHALHFEVIDQIKQNNINIEYCIRGVEENYHGEKSIINQVIIDSPEIQFDPITKFLFKDNLQVLVTSEYYLSRSVLARYAYLENKFLRLTDRSAVLPISVHQRVKYFQILLNYFIGIHNKYKFTHVLCFDTPHSYFSYLFYEYLKSQEVKVVRIEYHYYSDYCLVLNTPQMPLLDEDFGKNKSSTEFYNELPQNLQKSIKEGSAFVEEYTDNEAKRLVSNNIKGKIQLYIKYSTKYFSNIILGFFPSLTKKQIRHFTGLNKINSELHYRLSINKNVSKLYKLQKRYRKISTHPQLNVNYAFYAMHMQPEKTTLPLGEEMDHLLTSISIISNALPEGWKLYVKEHPNQFNFKKVANVNFRDETFYSALNRFDNITLVSINFPSKQLIKNAQIVATLTGTVGWEALLAGKPVLIFGDAYYKACKAVRYISDISSCKAAIKELSLMTPNDISRELYRYLSFYIKKNWLIESVNWESKIKHSQYTRKQIVNNLTDAIIERL